MLICPVVSFITLEGEFPEFAVHFLIPPKVSGGLILDWFFFVGCGSASGDRANSTSGVMVLHGPSAHLPC